LSGEIGTACWRGQEDPLMVQREIEVQADSTLREPALTFRSLGASGVIDGEDRMQPTLLPNSLEGYVARRTRFG
jgi:hypothetical protein